MTMRNEVIEEFTGKIPAWVTPENFPNNSLARCEMEWKHLCFALADEIVKVRLRANESSWRIAFNEHPGMQP
jgi:hypothetical protein